MLHNPAIKNTYGPPSELTDVSSSLWAQHKNHVGLVKSAQSEAASESYLGSGSTHCHQGLLLAYSGSLNHCWTKVCWLTQQALVTPPFYPSRNLIILASGDLFKICRQLMTLWCQRLPLLPIKFLPCCCLIQSTAQSLI